MERLRPNNRRAPFFVALVALALLSTGCGQNGPAGRGAAAQVNGAEISDQAVQDTVQAQRDFLVLSGTSAEKQRADAAAAGQQVMSAQELSDNVDNQIAALSGSGSDTIATGGAADALSGIINLHLLKSALADAGGKLTEEQRDAARTQVEDDIKQLNLTGDQVPKVLLDAEIERAALRDALKATAPPEIAAPAPTSDQDYTDQLRAIYDSQSAQFDQLCIKVIQTTDEAVAQQARTRIEGGEDFAAVATELSVDGGQGAVGGADSCVGASQVAGVLGDDALTAKPGDLLGPGAAPDGSFLLIQVDEVQTQSFEEARPALESANPNTAGQEFIDAALDQYVSDALAKASLDAKVTIDPRYGTWDPLTQTVVPPVDPGAARLAPAPSNDTPPASDGTVSTESTPAGPGGP